MKIDIKNQEFLKAIYYLNKNNSNAVLEAQRDFYKLFFGKYERYPPQYIIYNEHTKLYSIYGDIGGNKPKSSHKYPLTGHRKKTLNADDIKKIKDMRSQKISDREIAKIMKVDPKTIRNYNAEIEKE